MKSLNALPGINITMYLFHGVKQADKIYKEAEAKRYV